MSTAVALSLPGERDRERVIRSVLAVVAAAGIGVASYLTYAHYAHDGAVACPIGGSSCTTVQQSEYADLLGVPVAAFGVAAYAGLLVAAALAGPLARALGLLISICGVAFSAWLTYASVVLIEATCAWCTTSAALITISLALCILRATLPDPTAPPAGPGGAGSGPVGAVGRDVGASRDEAGVGQPQA